MIKDASYYADLLRSQELSFEELLQEFQMRVANLNPHLNAVVDWSSQIGRENYAQLNDRFERPFYGLPVLVKALGQDSRGLDNANGSRLLKGSRAQNDNNFIRMVKEAGLVPVGVSNAPEFGFKNITDSVLYGHAKNPWNQAYSPGGSSGGAAASVASGMFPLALASDGGGSIRIPASFCGLIGLKPTRGTMPVGPGSWRSWQGASINFALTVSMRDTRQLFYALRRPENIAPYQAPQTEWIHVLEDSYEKRPLKVAFSTQSPVGSQVSSTAVQAVKEAVDFLEAQGFLVEEKTPKLDGRQLIRGYYAMNGAETAAMFADLEEQGSKIQPSQVEALTWGLARYGDQILAREYTQILNSWDVATATMEDFLTEYDLYLTPTTAKTAPRLEELSMATDAARLYAIQDLDVKERGRLIENVFEKSLSFSPFTQLANLTGQPALSLPTHLSQAQLPLGVQFMAAKGREDLLFEVGHLFESAGQFELPPVYQNNKF